MNSVTAANWTRRRFLAGGAAMAAAQAKDLIGHWRLEGDARDASGFGHHGENRGAELTSQGARFNGRSGSIEIPDSPALRLGAADFTITARVRTERDLDDVVGDIVSKYDPVA